MSDTPRSPLSGCVILITVVLVLLFLIGFAIWQPIRQSAEIEKFTRETPVDLPSPIPAEHEEQARALAERLELFRSDLSDPEKEVRLELSAEDINLAIAMFEPLEELRGTFHVERITDGYLETSICYKLNRLPEFLRKEKGGDDYQYLVGTIHAKPMLSKRELALSVDKLIVPGAEIPEGFMGHFSTLRIFDQSKVDEETQNSPVSQVMAALTSATIEGDRLILARTPGEPLPDVVSDQVFQKSGGKIMLFLGGAVIVFLLFAGTLLFLGYRTQLRKLRAQEETNPSGPDA